MGKLEFWKRWPSSCAEDLLAAEPMIPMLPLYASWSRVESCRSIVCSLILRPLKYDAFELIEARSHRVASKGAEELAAVVRDDSRRCGIGERDECTLDAAAATQLPCRRSSRLHTTPVIQSKSQA